MNTKENIIENSIYLFASRGYDAVSIRDIAKSVGIQGSSVYNHFESKEDIYNNVIKKCRKHIAFFLNLILENKFYKNGILTDDISDDIFIEEHMKIFLFLLTDKYSIQLRKILTNEKFKNDIASKLFDEIYIDNILNFQKKLFKKLIDRRILINKDPYVLALKFYSPVFLLFYKNNKLSESDNTALRQHILDFKHYYTMRG